MPSERGIAARRLYASGYFGRPEVWERLNDAGIYTLARHNETVAGTACCVTDICEEAHAEAGGTVAVRVPHSNRWIQLPVCQYGGHLSWLERRLDADYEYRTSMVSLALKLISNGAHAAIKAHFGVESLSTLTQNDIDRFNATIGIKN